MKITPCFPLVVPFDENDDVYAQKRAFLSAFQFDPHEVAQYRQVVEQELELVHYVRLSDREAYFYSPLLAGRNFNTDDEEVCFAYFDYKQAQYTKFPGQFYSTKDLTAHKKNKSLPTYLPWEGLEQHLGAQINGPYIETHFERWLSLQQKTAITAEINSTPGNKSNPRKL